MNIRQLQYFIEIANCKSINSAAKKLYISQSTLVDTINALEKELDKKLFFRSQRGVQLTDDGAMVYEDTLKIIDIIEGWNKRPDDGIQQKVHHFDIFAVPSLYSTLLEKVNVLLYNAHPNIHIRKHFYADTELINEDSQSEYISLFCFSKTDEQKFLAAEYAKNRTVKTLFSSTFQLYLNNQHPLAQRQFVIPDDIYTETITLLATNNATINTPSMIELYNEKTVRKIYDQRDIFQLVAHNKTATIAASFLANFPEYVCGAKVKNIPIADYDTDVFYALSYPNTLMTNVHARKVIELILKVAKEPEFSNYF